jgi:3-hydroxybutyrate dehydrogenase
MDQGRTTEPLGRTALVTGAGTGIGRAIALELARRGCRVALLGRRPDPIQRVAVEIASKEGEALPIPCDVTDDGQVAAALDLARSALGPVEILVNNAGMAHSAPITKVTDADWDRLMALNVRSVFVLVRHVVAGMKAAGWGRIVNVASIAAHRGWRYTTLYTASKHAVGGLTRSLAAELLPFGITVNAVCPGYVDTAIVEEAARVIADRTGRTEAASRDELASLNPIQRLIEPREVAACVLGLCGPASGAVTGQSLIIDGGSQPV